MIGKTFEYLQDKLPHILVSLLIFIIGWVVAKYLTKLIMKFIERSKIDSSAEYFFNSFILITFRILVILISLSQLGVDVTTLVTAIGAATVTVGLALQDTLGNVASGILLIFTQPFKEGDYLKIGADEGTVTKIELFSTHINTVDNKEIVIPNRNVTASSVINYSSNEERRVDLNFQIAYDNDIIAVKELIRNVGAFNANDIFPADIEFSGDVTGSTATAANTINDRAYYTVTMDEYDATYGYLILIGINQNP